MIRSVVTLIAALGLVQNAQASTDCEPALGTCETEGIAITEQQ